MATRFYLDADTSVATPFLNPTYHRAATETVNNGTSMLSFFAGPLATGEWLSFRTTVSQHHNSSTWPNTGFGYSVDIATTGADLTYNPEFYRCWSDGSNLTSSSIRSSWAGTGIHADTGWSTAGALTTGAIGDKLGLRITVTNANMMDSQSSTIDEADTWVENTNFSTVITQPVAQVSQVNTAQVHTRNKRKTLGQARR